MSDNAIVGGRAASTEANTIATNANTAARTANTASNTANTAATAENTVASAANTARRAANTAATEANTVATVANVTAQRSAAGAATGAAASMGVMATAGMTARAGLAALGGPLGVAITALTILIPLGIEYASTLGEEANAAKKAADALAEKNNAVDQEISKANQREHAAISLANAYNNLSVQIANGTLRTEEAQKAEAEMADLKHTLIGIVGQEAVAIDENGRINIGTIKRMSKAEKQAAIDKLRADRDKLESEKAETQNTIELTKQRIEAIKSEIEAMRERAGASSTWDKIAASVYRGAAWFAHATGQTTDEEYETNLEKANLREQGVPAEKLAELDMATKRVSELQGNLDKLNPNIDTLNNAIGNLTSLAEEGSQMYNHGEIEEPEEKASAGKSAGKSAGSDSRQNNMQDPRILAHVSRIDEIASNTSNQVSLLNDIKSQQGNSKELSIQTFDTYQRGIDELKAERQRLNDYLYTKNVNAFNGQFSVTISDTAASDAVVEAAMPYLEKTMENGTKGCVEAVTKIGKKTSSFLAKELENGVVYVPRLISDAENAGIPVIPYDANNVGAGDIIVYDNNDHVVMADGKGGYVGNSSGLNRVVHRPDYTAMGDMVPTKIIKTGTIAGERKVQWSDSLANYAIDNDGTMLDAGTWDQAGLPGQIKLIEQALQVKGQENNEFLMQFSKVLLADLKSLNDADAKTRSLMTQQVNQWFTDMNAEVSQAGTTASQKGNRELFMLGSGATEYDKARIELQKNTAELSTMSEIVERKQTQDLKNTVAGKAFLDSYLQKQMTQRDLQFKTVVAMYNDAKATTDHNVKMRDYGYNNTDDRMGVKRATDTLADAMVQVELQRRQLELARDTDEKNYQEIRKMEESYKDALEALRTAQRQYNQQVLDGFEQIAEDFMFNGKSFRDIIDNLWQDLGKDALRALFGQDIGGNHSFLATLLGIGKPDEEMAKAQA